LNFAHQRLFLLRLLKWLYRPATTRRQRSG